MGEVQSPDMRNYLKETSSEIEKLVSVLKEYDISFCLLGGKALPFYGYTRWTEDVDILVSEKDQDKLAKIPPRVLSDHSRLKPYRVWRLKHFPKTDETKVDMLFSNDEIGSGIKYPDPKKISHIINNIPVINLYDLIKYKIASGIHGARSRDFGDIEELIKINDLPSTYMENEKTGFIKKKYLELYKNAMIQKESFDKYYR